MSSLITNKIPIFDHMRFLSKISVSENGCWEWMGEVSKIHGYGRIYFKKKKYNAHRVSYDMFFGIKERTTVIDHICRNKSCVNPDHLREVTVRTNTLENSICSAVHKKAQTHCINGHEYTKENTIVTYGKQGGERRSCRQCHRVRSREWARKNYKHKVGPRIKK